MEQSAHIITQATLPEAELPPESSRCTDILGNTLQGYAGIRAVKFDVNSGDLHIDFDPRLLSQERALQLVRQAGRQAGARVSQCAARSDAACAACAAQMGARLAEHYRQVENIQLNQTRVDQGVIDVQLENRLLAGENSAALENIYTPAAPARPLPARPLPTRPLLPRPLLPRPLLPRPLLPRPSIEIPRRKLEVIFTVINAGATLAAFVLSRMGGEALYQNLLFGIAFVFGGFYGLVDGLEAARQEHKLDVNLLMILAALGSAIIGQPLEGAILLFLFSLSNTLQIFALERNRRAIQKLLDLRPPQAAVRRGSRLVSLPVEKVIVGDVVLVRPGERIPVDGEVIQGESDLNQATITGESAPVHKKPGEVVFASTVNGHGALEIRVTHLAKDTTLAKIVQMVETAQGSKARTQTMLDSFEQVYAWFVLGGAALLTVVPLLFMGQAFFPTFYRAMTWLVVASPCALVISTPASILSAIANGARHGVLFKGGIHLEKTANLKVVAFDKTGTLTLGTPRLTTLYATGVISEDELLSRVAAVETRSEHPLGRAILQAAQERHLTLPTATEFRAIPGQGIEANLAGGRMWVGNRRLFAERGLPLPAGLEARLQELETQGQTVMIVSQSGEWLGLLGVADTLRPNAAEIVQQLKHAGVQRVVMLTGDNEQVARTIAAQAGVDEFHAGLLPQDKVSLLETLRHRYGEVAMVGDGVNDAPALATADIGVAMGGAGSDVALETADLVLMSDDLSNLPHAVALARRARTVIWQNLTFALAVIVLLVVSAFGFALPLPLGVVGHEGSTVLVVLNGLRLLGYHKE